MAKIGIDLGTTNSLGAVFRDGQVELIPNKLGKYITPSVVSLDENGEILVGDVAKQRLITHPHLSASSFKKDMGTGKLYTLGNKKYSPENLSSFIIASIVEDAKNYLKEEIDEVVISVPAYFHDKKRIATKNAGALANVNVNRLINEPSAAALSSYVDINESKLFLVFDFGGGTLDISIVECFDNMVEILSVSGDNRLGGDDFNEVIARSFLEENEIQRKKLSSQEYAILLNLSEKTKIKLTDEEEVVMSWTYNGKKYNSRFNTQRIIEDGSDLFSRIKAVIDHALIDGNLMASDIDSIIFAGGSSKMPSVKAYINHLFKNTSKISGNEQESIAYGLGNIIGIMNRDEIVKDYILSDICPFTLGIATFNKANPDKLYMTSVLSRNTALPSSKVSRFYTTRDNQESIGISVLQGENPYAEDNIQIGKFSVGVPLNKAGKEAIDVRFTYDINGILEVDVTILSNGKQINRVFSSTLNEEQLAVARQNLRKLKKHPKEAEENLLIKERLKTAYVMASGNMKEFLMKKIETWDRLLNEQNDREIKRYKKHLEIMLDEIAIVDPFYTGDNIIDFNDYNNEG